ENKKIIKKDGNSSVSEHEDFKQLKNNENNENNEITSSNRHMKSKLTKKYRKEAIKYILSWLTLVAVSASIPIIGLPSLMILLIPSGLSILFFQWRLIKCNFKLKKIPK
ncbi:Protein of unknown function (DUF2031), putative, partial [Plasmodium berghei]